ncbi:MAG: tetratricopeptide repeat protein [Planctomycetota bacterium]
MCHAQGAQLMMVLFPFLHELGPDYGYRAVHEQIAALCAAQHIPLLDLLALFEQHESEDLVVNRHDAHPNERAQGMAASAIDAFLARAMTGDVAGPVNELYLRGLALTRAGSKDAAAACLTQALRLFPDHADSHSLLGLLALQGGEGDRALQHFRAAAELCPWSASEQNNVGLAWARLGDADAALAAYTRALVLEPEFPEAHANAARTLEQLGADDAADRHYREALRLDAGDAETHADFGRLLARQRRDREASQHLRESLRLKPDGVAAATRLAWLLATSEDASVRDPALSLQWAERAVSATQQREPAPLDALAAALAEAGRFAEAAVAAEQALALARSTHAATLAADIEKRLQSYRSQRRAREQS